MTSPAVALTDLGFAREPYANRYRLGDVRVSIDDNAVTVHGLDIHGAEMWHVTLVNTPTEMLISTVLSAIETFEGAKRAAHVARRGAEARARREDQEAAEFWQA